MKSNKFLIPLISIFFISFNCFFTSCQTISFIPGQRNKVIDNIYVEYAKIGDTYYKLEDYTNAIKYYKLALPNKTIYWDVYCKLAKTYALSSNWTEALTMYKQLLKRDPENSSIKASIAYIYSMQGDVENALSIYMELLEIEVANEKYLENTIALLMPDKESYEKNQSQINELLERLNNYYPDNKNIERFNSKIKEYTKENSQESSSN